MKNESRRLRSTLTIAAFSCMFAFAGAGSSQESATPSHIGAPQDWSTRHVIYTNPDTPEEADRNGRSEEWQRKALDPRFVVALTRKMQAQADAAAEANDLPEMHLQALLKSGGSVAAVPWAPPKKPTPPKSGNKLVRDWNTPLGSGTGGAGTAGMYPAKYSFDINAAPSCANDFVVYTTATAGANNQATLVAFNNLYGGTPTPTCSGTVPGTFWAYNTGTGAVTRTSPALSYYDGGKQVAFVQSNSSNQAQLVLLKWSSVSPGTAGAPTTLATTTTAADYHNGTGNCAGGVACMFVMTFSGNPNDSYSSPFVDYGGDTLWVGDDNSKLHKFTNVFRGTPAEVTTGGFPAAVDSTTGLNVSSPVYDFAGHVFVGTSSKSGGGGSLYRVDASTGAVIKSARLNISGTDAGLRDSPLLDISNSTLYAFVVADNSTSCSGIACIGVIQFPTNFALNSTGTKVTLGASLNKASTTLTLYAGTFDNAYWNSTNGTGNMYVCGTTPSSGGPNVLWKIPISANVMQTPVQGPSLGNVNGSCMPVTDSPNGGHEYLFTSVPNGGAISSISGNVCSGACVYSFDLANLNGSNGSMWGTTNKALAGLAASGGASGIIIDNVSGSTGASQIYFSTLTNPGSAVQASQAGLQ